jgi:hypothetical protein
VLTQVRHHHRTTIDKRGDAGTFSEDHLQIIQVSGTLV